VHDVHNPSAAQLVQLADGARRGGPRRLAHRVLHYDSSMLEMTYLGWQGWMASAADAHVLIDPLLLDECGRAPRPMRFSSPAWPPAAFDLDRLPPLAAVLLSHEHADHFNIPSLHRVDRRTPILLPTRSSIAARTILAEMGFHVLLYHPGQRLRVGSLTVATFPGDQLALAGTTDEWDTTAYLVSHADGAFFTNVDVPVTDAMAAAADAAADAGETLVFERLVLERWQRGRARSTADGHDPSRMRQAAAIESSDQALAVLRRGEPLRLAPGVTVQWREQRLVEVAKDRPWLHAQPLPAHRARNLFPNSEPLEPASGRHAITDDEHAELEGGLADIARFMYGRRVFQALYGLPHAALRGRAPTFAWLLMTGEDEGYAVEYRPEECAFVEADAASAEELVQRYAGFIACWATDLLCLLRGEVDPRHITSRFREEWVRGFTGAAFFHDVVWPYFHPLRHPRKVLASYRRVLAEEQAVTARLRCGDAPVQLEP
jgi:hypothetical protein